MHQHLLYVCKSLIAVENIVGVYKPRVRCYDVNQLSMKFERCIDSDVMNFTVLSEDYSKVCECVCVCTYVRVCLCVCMKKELDSCIDNEIHCIVFYRDAVCTVISQQTLRVSCTGMLVGSSIVLSL